MNRRVPICGGCGAVVVEDGSVLTLSLAGPEPPGEATLCRDCTARVLELLGPRAFRPVGPRKGVVDPRRFENR